MKGNQFVGSVDQGKLSFSTNSMDFRGVAVAFIGPVDI
jgi:hypothetical protein